VARDRIKNQFPRADPNPLNHWKTLDVDQLDPQDSTCTLMQTSSEIGLALFPFGLARTGLLRVVGIDLYLHSEDSLVLEL